MAAAAEACKNRRRSCVGLLMVRAPLIKWLENGLAGTQHNAPSVTSPMPECKRAPRQEIRKITKKLATASADPMCPNLPGACAPFGLPGRQTGPDGLRYSAVRPRAGVFPKNGFSCQTRPFVFHVRKGSNNDQKRFVFLHHGFGARIGCSGPRGR